jgi:hypothetical protein
MDRDAEIDQIEGELEILRAHYAQFRRTAGILKAFFMALILLFAIGGSAFAIKLFLFDTMYGVFFVGALVIFVPGIIWLISLLGLCWIDFASQQPRGIYNPYFFYPDANSSRRVQSDAELIEQQIADRERRLSELGARVSGSNEIN